MALERKAELAAELEQALENPYLTKAQRAELVARHNVEFELEAGRVAQAHGVAKDALWTRLRAVAAKGAFRRAQEHMRNGKWGPALEGYHEALALGHMRPARCHNGAAIVYIGQGQFDEAFIELAKAVAADPYDGRALRNRSALAAQIGNLGLANRDARVAERLCRKHTGALQGRLPLARVLRPHMRAREVPRFEVGDIIRCPCARPPLPARPRLAAHPGTG